MKPAKNTKGRRTPAYLMAKVRVRASGLTLCALALANPAWAISVSLTSPANSVVAAPATITLSAMATPGAGRRILRVDFFRGTTRIATDTSAPYGIVWSNVPMGNYILTAIAIDSGGSVAISNPVVVRVDNAPTVSLTSPLNNAVFAPRANIALSAVAADADEAVAKVEFFQGDTRLGTQFLPPYNFTWNNVPTGRYTLTAKVTDLVGLVTISAPVAIVVDGPPSVIITAPANNATFASSASVTVVASASDADGVVTRVDFFDGGRLVGTASAIPGNSTYSATLSNLAAGAHTLTAVATDDLGITATSDPLMITVSTAAAQMYYIQTDHLNTPRLVQDQNASVVWRWDQGEPFGATKPNADPDEDRIPFDFPLRLPGQYFDQETNLAYNYFRDHDPATGRYVESDPIGLHAGLNTYAYVKGNPLTNSDPLGLLGKASGAISPSPYCGPRPTAGCVPTPPPPEPAPLTCEEDCKKSFETCKKLVDWYPAATYVVGAVVGIGLGGGLRNGGVMGTPIGAALGNASPKVVEGLTGMNQSNLYQGCQSGLTKCLEKCHCE